MIDRSTHPLIQIGYEPPFRFTGVRESVYQACPDAPIQPGSSCDYCGARIRYVYNFADSKGRFFKLGSECCKRGFIGSQEEWTRLQAQIKATANAKRRETAAVRREAAFQGRLEAERVRNEAAGLGRKTDREIAIERAEARRQAAFEQAEAERLQREAAKAASRHVGVVGERIELEVTLDHKLAYESNFRFGGGAFYIYLFKDSSGNRVVYKTSSGLGVMNKGETFKLRATVKEHGERDGELQTIIARAKKLEP
jgi:hypothetical protein